MPTKLWAQEPYAVLSEDGLAVTFYYDDQKSIRGGIDINNSNFSYGSSSPYGTATTAVIDVSFAEYKPTSTAYWFQECSSLATITGMENLNTQNVTSMRQMFYGCSGLTSLDVSHFDTQNVTNMVWMFGSCSGLTSLDVSSFKTDNVINLNGMFLSCSSLTNLDVSGFKTDNVWDMHYMFAGCSGLTSLDLSGFNTEKVEDMSEMFRGCSGLTSLDVSNFNTSSVSNMQRMFEGCSSLTSLDLSSFNTQKVTNMQEMFRLCSSLTSLDVSRFNTENVTNMSYMFHDCSGLTSLDLRGFKTDKVWDMADMFNDCSSLKTLDLSGFNTTNVKSMTNMFINCSSLTSLDLSGFKTTNVESMDNLFCGCSALTSLDVSGFNTDNVRSMVGMFSGCSGLTSLDVSGFKTDNVTSMGKWLNDIGLFSGCSGLTSLDLSNFNTAKVEDMSHMFSGCTNLKTIYVGSGWTTEPVVSSTSMFGNCTKLVGGAGTSYDANQVDKTYAHIDGGPDNPGYFTAKGQGTGNGFSTCADVIAGEDGKTYRVKGRVKKIVNTTYGNWYIEDDTDSLYIYGTLDYAGRFPRNGMSWESHGVNVGDIVAVQGPKQTYNGTPELVNVRVLTPMTLLNVSSNDEDMSVMKDMQGIILSPNASTVTTTLYYEGEDCEVIIPEEAQSWLTIQSTLKDNGDAEYKFDIINNSTSALRGDYILFRTTKIDSAIRDSVLYETKLYIGQAAPVSEPYAVLTGDTISGMTLTFYYDKKKLERNGMGVGPFEVTNYDDYELVNSGWDQYRDHITTVVFDDSFADCQTITSTSAWFYDFSKLTTIINIGNLKTDNVYSMGDMFWGCESLETIDVSGFNTSNVWDFGGMFGYCFSLKSLDISNFDTSSSTWMRRMFDGCSKLTTLDVSKFKTDNVTNMLGLFMNCSGLTSLDVSGFKTDNVTDISEMFYGCSGLTSLDVSGFNTENVTTMWGMFSDCSSLTSLDVSHFDTKNVTTTTRMFDNCKLLTNLDVSNFNTDNNIGIGAMFRNCASLTSIDVSRFNTSNTQYLWSLFEGCTNLTSVDVSGFNTENVIQMSRMFKNCPLLTNIDVSHFKTDNVTAIRELFWGCSSLTNLDISGFNTANVTDMYGMFYNCSKLSSLDLSSFNTSKVIYDETAYNYGITGLFYGCSGLTTIFVGDGWTTANLTESPNVFTNCTHLVGGMGTAYDSLHVDYTYAHIDGGPDNPGYLTKSLSMGDANGDGDVNIADAVVTVTSILGQPIEGNFYRYAADMNNDSEIDIFDVSMIVSNVLGAKTPAPALTRGNIDHVPAEAIRLTADANHIYMDIDQAQLYTAFQFDMSLPEGMSLDGVKLASGITDHQVSFVKRSENEYRVVGLSLSNEVLRSADGHLIQLQISNTASEDHVKVSNMLFVTPAGKTVTGIGEHLNTTMTTDGNIYNLKGEKLGLSRQQLGKGIFIMNHKKVIIK